MSEDQDRSHETAEQTADLANPNPPALRQSDYPAGHPPERAPLATPPSPEVVVSQVEYAHHEQYSGPLPHPRHLEYYENVLSGAADRILTMAEAQVAHRHLLEHRGQWMPFATVMTAIGIGGALLYFDKPLAA